jgi:hypothetical protein
VVIHPAWPSFAAVYAFALQAAYRGMANCELRMAKCVWEDAGPGSLESRTINGLNRSVVHDTVGAAGGVWDERSFGASHELVVRSVRVGRDATLEEGWCPIQSEGLGGGRTDDAGSIRTVSHSPSPTPDESGSATFAPRRMGHTTGAAASRRDIRI